ncbi:MAG TPA: lipase family protein [Thermoanaerobaculia bacterium]|jgi:hypothetical protein
MTIEINPFDPGGATDFFTTTTNVAFDPADAAYNRRNSRWLAEFSRLMYVRDTAERAKYLVKGFTEKPIIGTASTEVAIFQGPRFDVLAFRGTQLDSASGFLRDLLVNAGAALLPWPHPGRVHSGIGQEIVKIWPRLEENLGDDHSRPLFVTGHSLGGALATLVSAVSRKRMPRATYTFGAPRVGDEVFVASTLPVPIHRVENAHDPVPMVPRIQAYVPAGRLQAFSARGVLPSVVTRFFVGRAVQAAVNAAGDLTKINLLDHDPLVYVRNV